MTGFLHDREFSRKTFLKGGGALVIGFNFLGVTAREARAANVPNMPPDPAQIDSYLSINVDDTVTIYPPMMEFGQGTWTGFRQIVAEELDVPVVSISIGLWDSGSAHPFPDWGQTAGSSGTAKGGPPLRQAAAEARRTLLSLASAQLGVSVSSLSVVDGVVQGAGKSVKYSDLLGGRLFNTTIASGAAVAPLKPVGQYKVVGTRVPRFDIPDIVTGTLTYLQNVRVPEMLHGRPVRPRGQASVYGQSATGGPASFTVIEVDENSIGHIAGARVVRKGNFVGVVAPTEYDAIQGAAQLKVKWAEADTLPASANQFQTMRGSQTISPPAVELDYGNVDTALAATAKTLSATYEWPFQMHGPIGPCCAIADVTASGATIFTSGQNAWGSRNWVAQALGLPASTIRIVHYIGSSTYGPDNHNHPPVDAAIMSQIVGKPVRVQWMRWDSHGWESYGVNNIADIRAGLDANGRILAYDYTSWLPANSGNDQSAPPGIVQLGLPIPAEATGGGSTRGAPSRLPGITSKKVASPLVVYDPVELFSAAAVERAP